MEINIERAFVCLKLKRSQRLTVVEGSFGLSFVAERRQSDEIREKRKSVLRRLKDRKLILCSRVRER